MQTVILINNTTKSALQSIFVILRILEDDLVKTAGAVKMKQM